MLDLPEVEEYPDNVVPDRRQGAIGYLVGKRKRNNRKAAPSGQTAS